MPDLDEITIRPLEPGDTVTGLSLGRPEFQPLKTFLQRDAKRFNDTDLGRTYVAVSADGRVRGYVTLVCGQIVADGLRERAEIADFAYEHFPAVKLARLAVDARLQGHGLGKALLTLAVGIVKDEIRPRVGCRFVVLDAKHPSIQFYERHGFTLLDTTANREARQPVMYMDLSRIPRP